MRAFVFPGQGSQSVGMLAELARTCTVFSDYYAIASEQLDFDIEELICTDQQQRLDRTEFTQPAILTCSVALWQLWLDRGGVQPDFVAGHSLGEYSAAVAAGVFRFQDAVRLVHQRGILMQQAVDNGVMLALVGLDHQTVTVLCDRVSQALGEYVMEPANFNAPGQVVVAGHRDALALMTDLARKAGAKRVIPLPVSVPSHCSLMEQASETFARYLERVETHDASIPLVQNVDALAHTDSGTIVEGLVQQIRKPVLWTQSVEYLATRGVTSLYECGPGKVLQGLVKRIDRKLAAYGLSEPDVFTDCLSQV